MIRLEPANAGMMSKENAMLLNHDQINHNHGKCLAIINQALTLGILPPYLSVEAIRTCEEMDAHHKAVKCEMADATIDAQLWRGDHCGYLAAQAAARIDRGLTPTPDQREAWIACNVNESKLSAGAI